MVEINKQEREIIANRCPGVHIVRTMKQRSKRHHYYCEEAKRAMRVLEKLRLGEDAQNGGGQWS